MLFWLMTLQRNQAPLPDPTDSYAFLMRVEVQYCTPRWGMLCPKRWARMLATDDARVRVCGSCGCEVTLCRTFEESCELIRRSPMAMMACAPEHFVEEVRINRYPKWYRQRRREKGAPGQRKRSQ